MSLPTIAVIIGVSQYLQKDIASLPAAQMDALKFARSIKHWGVPESNISLFLNADAERKAIDDYLSHLSQIKDEYRLLFYFCGHGHRISSEIPQSYLLFHDSYIQDNQCLNSLSLDLIIKNITKLNAVESYVFIDACYLRVNTIINPKLEEELKGRKVSHKSLFCLLSSGIQESYESERGLYGYFTEALLKSLCKIRKSECSPTHLLHYIHKDMEAERLPLPEMYNFGAQKISFLSYPELCLALEKGFIYRQELIAKIQDTLIENRDKFICLVGETGIGKSAICQYLESEKFKVMYISIPPSSSKTFEPVDFLAAHIKEKLKDCFKDIASSPEILLKFNDEFPFYLIIIDQLERLNPAQLHYLLNIASELRIRFLFTSSHSLKDIIDERFRSALLDLEIPPFSYEEGKLLIRMINPDCSESDCELIYLVAKGNPLKMRKASFFSFEDQDIKSVKLEKEFKKAIAAVYACGFYINEQLFIKNFSLQEEILRFLEEIGLISHAETGWVPHEFLYEIVETEMLPIDRRSTCDYWYQQLEDLPDNEQASRYLVLTIRCFGYEKKAEEHLKIAFQALYYKGRENLCYLVDGLEIFLPLPYLTEAGLLLAEILMEWGQSDLAYSLLTKQTANENLILPLKLCKAQKYWRTGDLKKSLGLCSEVIEDSRIPLQAKMNGYFHRGCVYFLNGNWKEALSDFNFIYENAKDTYYVGRAQCMLGSIEGLRGTHLQLGKEHLENGTRLLVKLKDLPGVWAGWNNLGEICWKCGEYRTSLFYLEKALELTRNLGHTTAKLETLRNLLHLHLRMSGPLSKYVTDLISEIEQADWNNCESFAQAQILNTLSTAYLFRRNTKRPLFLLKHAIPLTSDNNESHIYTLFNLALFFRISGKDEKAELSFNKALKLAEKGENLLALHQLKTDFEMYNPN